MRSRETRGCSRWWWSSPAAFGRRCSARFLLPASTSWLGGRSVGAGRDERRVWRRTLRAPGLDAGIATGLLGAFWGYVYLRLRSSIANRIVSHAGFDFLQIVPFLGLR